ncbi:MAG: hypothetical protein U1F46_15670 [Marinagarivorans sp.]
MEIAELERLGDTLCMSLLNQDFSDIAQNIAYALQAERPLAVAIKEDFECARTESGGNLELANYSVVIKKFQAGTPGFIHLIECRFTFPNTPKEILVEIIENEAGCYLEQITSVPK